MIDREKVFQMAKTGFTKTEIANRLGCSRRQVTRIVKRIEMDKNVKFSVNYDLRDKDVENAVRGFCFAWEGGQATANRFGVSRQAIFKGIEV